MMLTRISTAALPDYNQDILRRDCGSQAVDNLVPLILKPLKLLSVTDCLLAIVSDGLIYMK
jgi:hypothetical protein